MAPRSEAELAEFWCGLSFCGSCSAADSEGQGRTASLQTSGKLASQVPGTAKYRLRRLTLPPRNTIVFNIRGHFRYIRELIGRRFALGVRWHSCRPSAAPYKSLSRRA